MRTLLVTVAINALVGTIATVGVAWWSAMYADLPIQRGSWVRGDGTPWPEPVDPSWPDAPDAVSAGSGAGYSIRSAKSMVRRPRPPTGRPFPSLAHRLDVHDIGWPLRAFRWEGHETAAGVEYRHALTPPPWLESTAPNAGRRLPLRPLWRGVVGDAFLFAVASWLVASTPTAARRFVRGWRGRCPRCGYDLRGSTAAGCPECGYGRSAV